MNDNSGWSHNLEAQLARLPDCNLVCLSPHFDDAVLSCGGIMAKAVNGGATVVAVTIFAGEPDTRALMKPHVQAAHRRWRLADNQAVSLRRAEDQAALSLLGVLQACASLPDHLYWPHAGAWSQPTAWRRWMQRLKVLMRPDRARAIAARRHGVESVVRACLARWPTAALLAPCGIGGHPDHRLTMQVAREVVPLTTTLGFYEDLPYAAREDASGRLGQDGALVLQCLAIGDYLAVKSAALGCYVSQLEDLFGSPDQIPATVERWAGAEKCERLWQRRGYPMHRFLA